MLPKHLSARAIQRKVLRRKTKSGNPVVNHRLDSVPKWRALQLEKRRLLKFFRRSYRGRTHITEEMITKKAIENVNNIYKRKIKKNHLSKKIN